MNAKSRLMAFLKHAKNDPDNPYTWLHDGDEPSARVFVHRMRVELSDMRHTLKLMSRPIRPFKMLLEAINVKADGCEIVLRYRTNDSIVMNDELNALADMIAYDTRPTLRPVVGGLDVKAR